MLARRPAALLSPARRVCARVAAAAGTRREGGRAAPAAACVVAAVVAQAGGAGAVAVAVVAFFPWMVVGGFVVEVVVPGATSIRGFPGVPAGGGPVPVAVPPSRVTPATARMFVPVAHLGRPGTGEILGTRVRVRFVKNQKGDRRREEILWFPTPDGSNSSSSSGGGNLWHIQSGRRWKRTVRQPKPRLIRKCTSRIRVDGGCITQGGYDDDDEQCSSLARRSSIPSRQVLHVCTPSAAAQHSTQAGFLCARLDSS